MRTLFGLMRALLGISVAAFVTVNVWSNLPIPQHQNGSTVSIEPLDKLFTRSIPRPAQD
jgi:hypothetical protein